MPAIHAGEEQRDFYAQARTATGCFRRENFHFGPLEDPQLV